LPLGATNSANQQGNPQGQSKAWAARARKMPYFCAVVNEFWAVQAEFQGSCCCPELTMGGYAKIAVF
jgi:hypothetical protein